MGTPAAMPDPDTVAWLLDCDDPFVRYFTLTLLGESADGVAAAKTRCRIMTEGAVPLILAAQRGKGYRCGRERFYTAKTTGTVWQFIILAQLGADGGDERLRRAWEVILCDSQGAESGGFSVTCAKAVGGRHGSVIPCLTGNLIFSLIKLGYLDDPRVRRAIDDADGDAPTGWPYDPWEMCWGRHACHMGAIMALKALAEKPPERCSSEVRRTLADGVEFRIRHHVHRHSHDLAHDCEPGWRRFGFPLLMARSPRKGRLPQAPFRRSWAGRESSGRRWQRLRPGDRHAAVQGDVIGWVYGISTVRKVRPACLDDHARHDGLRRDGMGQRRREDRRRRCAPADRTCP